jgi:hypothetical protein
MTGQHHAAAPTGYNYIDPAPKGVKLTLLTKGKVQVTGEWVEGGAFIAWAPLLKRDKQLEEEMGLL